MPDPVVVVVDVQERLFGAMDPARRDEMLTNVKLLCTVARRLRIPVIATEQYPKGLGPTLPDVRAVLDDVLPIAKTSFSCCGADGFLDLVRESGRREVVLTGIEAHVCVLLTALDLIQAGFRVSIAADAVCSRKPEHREIGLAQARGAGAIVTTTETVVFQLLGRADTEVFREVSKLLR